MAYYELRKYREYGEVTSGAWSQFSRSNMVLPFELVDKRIKSVTRVRTIGTKVAMWTIFIVRCGLEIFKISQCLCKGLFTWRKEDPSTRKILEGETTFRLVYMQKISVWVIAGNQIKLSVLSNRTPGRRHICFSVPSTRIFRAKAVYMVLGSS